MINPLPYVQYNDIITEEIYKQFIEALENEVISWDKVQNMLKNDDGMNYACEEIANHSKKVEEVENIGKTNFVLGSGICLNLTHLDKIPAFYQPPEARGEDTFFSCALAETNAKVLRVPVYHFHDAYLKFTFLMKDKFPSKLRKITTKDNGITGRFVRTVTGWTKYKPLLSYILYRQQYANIMEESKRKLKNSAIKVSSAFENCDLTGLEDILNEYDKNVEIHYKEYIETNNVWNKIKDQMKN